MADIPFTSHSEKPISFNDLPIQVQLNIFSYMGVQDLLNCASVCKYWSMLSCDEILWMRMLDSKMTVWKKIGSSTFPELCWQQGFSSKEIYLKNCYDNKGKPVLSNSISKYPWWKSLAKSILQPKPLDVVVFGSGLDSPSHASSIIRFLINCRTADFLVTRLYPGDKLGVGSGLCVKFQDIQMVLMILYSNFKKERECVTGEQRIARSRLYDAISSEDGKVSYVCKPSIRQVCEKANGFVFVVDGTINQNTFWDKFELFTLVHHGNSTSPQAELQPIIIWSCVPPNSSSKSCTTIAKQLELAYLKQPWKIWEVQVENHLPSVDESFEWLKTVHAKTWWK